MPRSWERLSPFPSQCLYFSSKSSGLSWHALDIILKHLLTVSSSWTGLFFLKSKTHSQFKTVSYGPGSTRSIGLSQVWEGVQRKFNCSQQDWKTERSEKEGVSPRPTHTYICPRRASPSPHDSADRTPSTSQMDPARSAQHALAGGKGREGKRGCLRTVWSSP